MKKNSLLIILAVLGSLALVVTFSGGAFAASSKEETRQAGKSNYNSYCVNCHGANMVNTGTRAFDLRRFPLNDLPRFLNSVKNGKKAMPAWKDILVEEEILEIWEYVKTRGK